jgi:uncharacterized protein YjbJ (UPF0337 family)
MNQDQAEDKWDQIEGRGRSKLGAKLTDDDFEKTEGSMDKLYGVIQKKLAIPGKQLKRSSTHFT